MLAVVLFHLFALFAASASVVGVDFGSRWLKIHVISPGKPIETVLDRESKRKTPNFLAINDGARKFGSEAQHLKDAVRGVELREGLGGASWAKSPALAMIVQYIVDAASKHTGSRITGIVFTVPASLPHASRQRLFDACDIVKVPLLGLIHDSTAVAVSYAFGKKLKGTYVFYDMGDLSTIAARVQYLSAEQKNFVDITVKDLAVDPALGGSHVDQRVKQYLIQKYNENHQPLGSSPKLHARFLREATRVKTILSANLFVIASLENIHGVDFRYRMERSELDELCKDLFDRSIVPLNSVLANTTLDEIEALVMVGGGVRIPAVQKKLVERVDGKLARNVDGDEAAVQGAVLHAASKSSLFQLGTTLRVKDLFLDQVEIVYGSERKMLFSPKSVMGLKKYSTIPYIKDFDFQIIMAGKKLCTVFVQGITKAIASGKAGKVRFEFKISDSGMFQIVDALFIANSTVITEQEKPDEGDNAGSVLDLLTKSNDSSKAPASAASKVVLEKIKLDTRIEWTDKPMTEAEKDKARVYLEEMDKADNLRLAREKARNDLETLLYKTKDVYYDEKDELLYASEKEVVEMKRVCDLISEWLEEHAETANTPQLEKYISTIEPLFRSIHQRKIEHDYRPSKLEALQNTLTSAEELVLQMAGSLKLAQSPGDADPSGRKAELAALYKQDELDMLTKKLADTTQWLNPLKAQQQALALNQDSVLTTVDLDAHNGHLKALLSKFSYADRVAKMEAEIIAKQKRETREREQKERLAAKEKARMVKLASEAAQAAETSNSDDPAIQETEDTHEEL